MILKRGTISKEVAEWQRFLGLSADGIFGEATEKATEKWQAANGLTADGEVGEKTMRKAGLLVSPAKSFYPPRPAFSSPNSKEREKMFGKFSYKKLNSTDIQILGNWTAENIVKIHVPQLVGVDGAPKDGNIYFHKKGVDQLLGFFEEVERQGLLHLIISWAGSFYPRFIRGSQSSLSNHSWGTAFDINAPQNWLNAQPATVGAKGSLLKLVPIANSFGFFWGGHYNSRLDGMHFELAAVGMFPEKVSMAEPVEDDSSLTEKTEAEVQPSNSFKIPNISEVIRKTQEVSEKIHQGSEIIGQVQDFIPGMKAEEDAIKVTSGKKTSFFINLFGLLMSVFTAVAGFAADNWKLIAIGFIGIILLGITVAVTFTVINALKMKYAADPTKYNVE